MEDNYINPNPEEPLFTRPLTPTEFYAAVRDCGRSVYEYIEIVSLKLRDWNITLDSDDRARRFAYQCRGLSMFVGFATNAPTRTRFTREYSYLMLLSEMLATWSVIFDKYRQGCECDGCKNTDIDREMCDEYIKGLAQVEITGE